MGAMLAVTAAYFCLEHLVLGYSAFREQYSNPGVVETYVRKFAPVREDLPGIVHIRYVSNREIEEFDTQWLRQYLPYVESALALARSDRPLSALDDHPPVVRVLVGMLSELPLRERRRLSPDSVMSLLSAYHNQYMNAMLVRYALAPHKISSFDEAEYVLGEFAPGTDWAAAGMGQDLDVVAKYDDGLVLLRRRTP